jgi:hypothetical protein
MALLSDVSDWLETLRDFQSRLVEWNTDSPSVTGHVLEKIGPEHRLHSAAASLESFYGGTLPVPALRHWRTLLRCSRNGGDENEESAEDAREWLRDWVRKEIEKALTEAVAKPDEGEGRGGAGTAPGQEQLPLAPTRESVRRRLEPAVRKAYLAYQYAEGCVERRLEDREAYEWLRENGIDQGKSDLDELTDYELPDSLETFRRYLGTARKSLGESKYTRRAGRKLGRTIARGSEIEYQKGDGR